MEFMNYVGSFIIKSDKSNNVLGDNIHNKSDCIRRDDHLSDSSENTTANLDISEKDDEKDFNSNINIYRYKFTNEFTNELFKFSKVHQYDHRKDFKEAWEKWTEDNDNLINEEIRRLICLGYDGDILDKMFKSARYYFRKKSTEKRAPAKRRIYVGSQKDLLEAMDEHIKTNIQLSDFKPSVGFDEFCKKHIEILKEQVNILSQAGFKDPNEIKAKIKKTYKNRYFLIISK
jgi:hypothetical protein